MQGCTEALHYYPGYSSSQGQILTLRGNCRQGCTQALYYYPGILLARGEYLSYVLFFWGWVGGLGGGGLKLVWILQYPAGFMSLSIRSFLPHSGNIFMYCCTETKKQAFVVIFNFLPNSDHVFNITREFPAGILEQSMLPRNQVGSEL
jgi:hypothetical protein